MANKNKHLSKRSSRSSQKLKKFKRASLNAGKPSGSGKITSRIKPKKASGEKREEREDTGVNSLKSQKTAILDNNENHKTCEDLTADVTRNFRLSLISRHPKETGVAAFAKVETFSLDRFDNVRSALSSAAAFSSVFWKNNTPAKVDFMGTDSITSDWDTPGHKTEMPAEYKDSNKTKSFIESLINGTSLPLPNFFYVTRRGIRMTWILAKPILDIKQYQFIALKIAADIGGDFNSSQSTTIFNSKSHIDVFGIHLNHSEAFDAEKYAVMPPTWSLEGDDELYPEALTSFGLVVGQSASSSNCPIGGHTGTNSSSIHAYENGVMCYSKHGLIRKSKIVELAGLSKSRRSLYQIAKTEIERFAPKNDLLDLLSFEIQARMKVPGHESKKLAEVLFESIIAELAQDSESQWSMRREYFHHKKYPLELREYCAGTGLRQLQYPEASVDKFRPTYHVDKYDFRDFPSSGPMDMPLLKKISSPLFYMVKVFLKDGGYEIIASPTPDMSRFLRGEAKAILNSSIYDLQPYTRPVAGVTSGWRLDSNRLPRRVIAPDLLYKGIADMSVVSEFCKDLGEHFSFEKPLMIYQYVGYLVQAMVCHHSPGENPVYYFKGPTHSGKGYLGNIFVGMLYCTQYGPGCHETNFKSGGYELDILMAKAAQYPYMVFDEIAYVSLRELKFIDRLATQQQIEVRKLHIGYATIANHMTVAMTAINKEFSDETKGRLVEISFTESRAEIIKKFHNKWSARTSELLAAIFHGVSAVDFTCDIPEVEHRRTGFGIVKKAVEAGLRTETFNPILEYPLSQGPNEILDLVTRMFELKPGVPKGDWLRFTPKQIADFYNDTNPTKVKSEYMRANLTTALGYLTTEKHPAYKDAGYAAESGGRYHIKICHEGQGRGDNKRCFVYVKSLSVPSESEPGLSPDTDTRSAKPEPKPKTVQSPPKQSVSEISSEDSEFPIMEVES